MSYTTLISPAELAGHLQDGWAIVDCRYDLQHETLGYEQYQASHIPGAIYASLSQHLSATPAGSNGRHPLPSRDTMAATFAKFGIGADTQVVVYDQDSGMFASRLWWMLRYAGHLNVAVMNGGWARWISEQRPVQAGIEDRPATSFTPRWNSEWHVDLPGISALSGRGDVLLLDARAPERFEGRFEPLDRVPGHIPGAANHPYRTNLAADNTLLPPDVLRLQFQQSLGGHAPTGTVMYCGSGVSACLNLLAMEHAGLPGARLYVGSWSEWSADPDRPVQTGPARR